MLGNSWYGTRGSFRIILERFLPHLFLNEDKELAFTIPVGGGIIIGIAAGLIYEYITNKMKDDPATQKRGDIMDWLEFLILAFLNIAWILFFLFDK